MGDTEELLGRSSLRPAIRGFLDSKAQKHGNTADELWSWLESGGHPTVSEENIWNFENGKNLFSRGQADSAHGLTSSLYRECISSHASRLDEGELADAEKSVIGRMRDEGIGRSMTDGQLLMVLQHHGIPTRLIDVSKDPFVSLFFAIEKHESTDGRLFLIYPHGENMILHDTHDLTWSDKIKGKRRVQGDWAVTVHPVVHKSLDPRMHAQDGCFLVGGLSRTWGGQRPYRNPGLSPDSKTDVSNLNLNFMKQASHEPNLAWGGTAWNVLIKSEWKVPLLTRLREEKNISSDTMYPPLSEVKRLARFAIKGAMSEHCDHSKSDPAT